MYLSFNQYKEYGGKIQDEAIFKKLEFDARMDVDNVTNGRLKDYDEETSPIKENMSRCMFCLIEDGLINQIATENAQKFGGSVSSISNDGYSVSFDRSSNGNNNGQQGSSGINRVKLIQKYLEDYSYRGW